jgi:proteasome lid subunit RPN8/RPN11/tetratricopeptide (TPR) repeat protein
MPEELEKRKSIESNNQANEEREPQESQPSVAKESKPVIIQAEAYKTIILYASRYANKEIPNADWKEIYGILTGYVDDDFVYVENAYALTFGHDTDVQLDQRHYIFIDEIQQRLDEEGKGHFIVGWFHSHPGLSLFFSYTDLINQLGFQAKNEDAVGLVFDHTLLGKKKEEKIGNNILTKHDTGFEIYKLTDVNMDPNAPEYETNYHKVDYIVQGLNKFFFANVLAELASLSSAGRPLQSAYKEVEDIEKNDGSNLNFSEVDYKSGENVLVDIPMEEDVSFNLDKLFYEVPDKKKETKINNKRESAEKLIYEGNLAFKAKDYYTAIEKYRRGIEIYKKLNEFERCMDLLRTLIKLCITNDHFVLAQEFTEDLSKLANKYDNRFYKSVVNYMEGYLLLKEGDNSLLKTALNKIRDSAMLFEKERDFAGAGMGFNKIGTIYQTRLDNFDSACLFYREAIENYNKAIIHSHPLRKSFWSMPESLQEKILELKDLIEELIDKLNPSIRKKILQDLQSINYNF